MKNAIANYANAVINTYATPIALDQAWQELHDKLAQQSAGSLSSYLVLFMTDNWLKQVDLLLPSFGSRNRLYNFMPIPSLSNTDIRALVYKSFYFHMMGNPSAKLLTEEQVEGVCKCVLENAGGEAYHLRSIQRRINQELLFVFLTQEGTRGHNAYGPDPKQ